MNRCNRCEPYRFGVIRNPKSSLVLDASEYQVKLQPFTGFPLQMWRLHATHDGKFFIVNKGNGKVLDIQGGGKNGAKLITYQKHGGPNQQWFVNSNGTVVSAADNNLAIDCKANSSYPGTELIVWSKHDGDNQKFGVIRNPRSCLVLDASQYHVKLQHFTGFPPQMWRLEATHDGKFFIVNQGTGKVLDIQGGATHGAKLITFQKHGGSNQQWFINSDDTIVSAGNQNLALDCKDNCSHPGTEIIAWSKHGADNQKFLFQFS